MEASSPLLVCEVCLSGAELPTSLLTPRAVDSAFLEEAAWVGERIPLWSRRNGAHSAYLVTGLAHGPNPGDARQSPGCLCPLWIGISGCRLLSDREERSTEPGRPWTRGFVSFGGGQRGLRGGSDSWAEVLLSNNFHVCFRNLNGGLEFPWVIHTY